MRNQHLAAAGLALLLAFSAGCKKSDEAAQSAAAASPSGSNATGTTGAKGEVAFKVKWPVGNRYVYRMDLDQHSVNKLPQMPNPMQQDMTMAMTYSISVLEEAPGGGRHLELEFLANEMEVNMGGQTVFSYDSKENSGNDAQNPMIGPFRKMIGTRIRIQTEPNGHLGRILGADEWVKSIVDENAGPATQMFRQQFNESFLRQLSDFGQALPTGPVRIGQTWPVKIELPAGPLGKLLVDSKVTLQKFEDHAQHHCAVLASKGSLTATPGTGSSPGPGPKMSLESGHVTATSWFDAELGSLIETSADQTLKMKGEFPAGPGPGGARPNAPTFTSDIRQNVTVKLVELTSKNG